MMGQNPVAHIEIFPPNKGLEEQLQLLKAEFHEMADCSIPTPGDEINSIASRWILLLFTQDLELKDVVDLWSQLFHISFREGFRSRLRRIFTGALVCLYSGVSMEQFRDHEELMTYIHGAHLPPVLTVLKSTPSPP